MARSWFWNDDPSWWYNQPSCWRTFACEGLSATTRSYAFLAFSCCLLKVNSHHRRLETAITYILLLLIHVADLEPDIGMCKWTRRVPQNAVEAHETVVVLTLLLVNDAETE